MSEMMSDPQAPGPQRQFVMPKLGLTMTEGIVQEWLAAEGQRFVAGQALVLIETDKVVNEIEAPGDGVLVRILTAPGTAVEVGHEIALWELDGQASPPAPAPALASASAPDLEPEPVPEPVSKPDHPRERSPSPVKGTGRIVATPLARRLAQSHAIDLAQVEGSGPGGRIKAADLSVATATPSPVPSGLAVATPPATPLPAPRSTSGPISVAQGTQRPLTSSARIAARRLADSKREIPHFYLSLEAEVSALLALREQFKRDGTGQVPTLSHFLIAACAQALQLLPHCNVVWHDDGQVMEYERIDIGLATDTPAGLRVPMLRDVAMLTLNQIAVQARARIEEARSGHLVAAHVGGGALTISNAGMHDVSWMSSIINPGQSMILGVGSVRELFRPDAAGAPALRRELGMVLSVDHRVLDGVAALQLLNAIRQQLERPCSLLLSAGWPASAAPRPSQRATKAA